MFGGGCPSKEQYRSTGGGGDDELEGKEEDECESLEPPTTSSMANVCRREAFRLKRGRYDM